MASRPLRTLTAFLVLLVPVAFCAARGRLARAEETALGFRFDNVAQGAGLSAVTVFGGRDHNKYLLETTGTPL